ncbi:DUF4870 domain-containing protein [Bacteroides nordii]|jgi:putative transmembrane protein|uniref:DUF4870 domain-containing protein n=1 Tax=Bacteroides nordii TaxID=291645 RepID=UPI00189C9819|nr:DUF4870 domain-containing protein [Bacteroides nordii]MCE8464848.1 DUF4870 domain-containing protein [Bacteroides nordii]MCQ4914706.1 DUF4870 domain-containing protein [Bacteroides nordii]UYU50156.1 DUF4870 domain-containing protein [Bacteroides nordii]
MDYKKLEELNNLRLSGALTEEEFEAEKKKLYDEDFPPIAEPLPLGLQESSYLGLMNFLIFVPYVGWVAPLIMWIMGKDKSEKVDEQGKYILNWYISWFIFGIILLAIFFVCFIPGLIGGIGSPLGVIFTFWPITLLFGIMVVAFPIIGGINGLNGKTWKYPLSMRILK